MDDARLCTNTDESFAAVAEHAPAMLWRGDAEGRCIYLNKALREFWGVAEDGIDRFRWDSTLIREDAEKVFAPFGEGMRKREPFTCEARYRRADGEMRILRTEAQPLFNAEGAFTGMVGLNVDVTDERRAQSELAESEARLRALADNLPYGMVYQITHAADGSRRFTFISNQCRPLNGVEPEAALADPELLYGLIAPEFRDAFAQTERAAVAALKPFDMELKIQPSGRQARWFRLSSAPRPLANGDCVWDGVQVDIHDLKVAEERRLLLMKEMGHRLKNTLSTVVSIATQTARACESFEAFNASFQSRLQALAKSHEMLTQSELDSAMLREILQSELRPYQADAGRMLSLSGEAVRLSGRAATGMALVVHELATNAAKYGAYAANGEISVSWRIDGEGPAPLVAMFWRERGGPPASNPGKAGFGSRLIESIVRRELGGDVVTRFNAAGFEADISFRTSIEDG